MDQGLKLVVIESERRLVPVADCLERHGGWEMNITTLGIEMKA